MPAAHGRSSAVFLNAYNVSSFLSSFDSTKTVDTAEVTTFGSTSKAYVTGLRDGTITLGGYFDGGAGALDEIMTMALSDTQVSYETDIVTITGNTLTAYSAYSGDVTQAATPITGFSGSVQFPASANRFANWSQTLNIGRNYIATMYCQMDDASVPRVSQSNTSSFDLAFLSATQGTIASNTIELITGSVYKISTQFIASVSSTFAPIQKLSSQSNKAFRISGLSINEVTTGPAPNPILSICEEGAGAIGQRCTVAQVIDTSYQITGSISDAVAITAEFQADGTGVSGAYRGVVLAPLAAYSNGQNTTGFDGGAASSSGLVANLHVLSAGGSTTVKIQHSTDNSSWTDLIAFTTGAVQFCEHKTTTGTVHRYLRVNVVTDGLPVMVVTAARK